MYVWGQSFLKNINFYNEGIKPGGWGGGGGGGARRRWKLKKSSYIVLKIPIFCGFGGYIFGKFYFYYYKFRLKFYFLNFLRIYVFKFKLLKSGFFIIEM